MSSAGEMTGPRRTSEARDLEPRGQLAEPVHLSSDFSHVAPSPFQLEDSAECRAVCGAHRPESTPSIALQRTRVSPSNKRVYLILRNAPLCRFLSQGALLVCCVCVEGPWEREVRLHTGLPGDTLGKGALQWVPGSRACPVC